MERILPMPGSVITGILKPTTCGTTGTELMKDQISKTLSQLRKGQMVTVVFDCSFAEERLRVTGSVVSVDNYWKMLQISNIAIDFSEICEIII